MSGSEPPFENTSDSTESYNPQHALRGVDVRILLAGISLRGWTFSCTECTHDAHTHTHSNMRHNRRYVSELLTGGASGDSAERATDSAPLGGKVMQGENVSLFNHVLFFWHCVTQPQACRGTHTRRCIAAAAVTVVFAATHLNCKRFSKECPRIFSELAHRAGHNAMVDDHCKPCCPKGCIPLLCKLPPAFDVARKPAA